MSYHARDPWGVRHVETRKQARYASILKTTLESIISNCEIEYRKIGDDELQRRIRVDDVIMSQNLQAAYVHIGADGDTLEKRQAYVWLIRNKGAVKTALAKRLKERGKLPQIYFVESKFDEWSDMFAKARKHPELNLPDPFCAFEQKLGSKLRVRDEMWKKWGIGDPNTRFPGWGYNTEM